MRDVATPVVAASTTTSRASGDDGLATQPWLVVLNPAAGPARRADAAWPAYESALREAGVPFEVRTTQGRGDGARIATEAWRAGGRRLLIAGGDGSLHDVVNGLMAERERVGAAPWAAAIPTVVPIPLGTGNDWSRSHALPRDPARLAALIARDAGVLHDVGRIDFEQGARPGDPPTHCWFINVAGAGFDARVIERMPLRSASTATYLLGALRELARYRSPRFEFEFGAAAGSTPGRLLLAFVANGRYCGGRMHVAPTARTDDGEFDLVTIDEVGLLRALPKLAKLYAGTILGDPLVRHRRSARIRIATDPVAGIEADGVWVGRTPAVFSVERQALRTLQGP